MALGTLAPPHAWVPAGIRPSELDRRILTFDQVEVEVLVPRIERIGSVLDRLEENRSAYLARLPVREIVAVVAEASRRWLDPCDPLRRQAVELLPSVSGFSRPMVELLLDRLFCRYEQDALWDALEAELGDPLVLDGFRRRRDGLRSRAFGPPLMTHVLGGNNPALATVSFVFGLLAKAASVFKVSSHEPLLPTLLARTFADIDPKLADSLLTVWWPGGDVAREAPLFERSAAVVVFGDAETVRAVGERVPHDRLVAYGNRIAVAIVGREALALAETADSFARDVALADQLSCLSPQVVYVEDDGSGGPRAFAAALARSLEKLATTLPRADPPDASHAALTRFRQTFEFRKYADPARTELFAPKERDDWLVVLDGELGIVPTPGYRHIRVCPVTTLADAVAQVKAVRPLVSSVGAALERGRREAVAEALGEQGVSRVCQLGSMLEPPLGWHHDGWWNLSRLLRWTDLEDSTSDG